jgi:hypothetical protein
MQPRRPTGVLVIAIFHFIVGGIGLISDAFNTFNVAGGSKMFAGLGGPEQARMTEELEKDLNTKVPGFKAYEIGNAALGWLFDVALITAGVGLLRMRSWARTLSLVYAVISLLHKILIAVYTFLYLMPVTEEAMRAAMPQQQGPARQAIEAALLIAKVSLMIAPFASMIYPLAVLIVLGRPSVGAAFRGERVGVENEGPGEPEDYDDRWQR